MPPIRSIAVALLVGIVAGYMLHGGSVAPVASAQNNVPAEPAAESAAGRLQITAFGARGSHGCYMVDTATGELWLVEGDRSPRRIQRPKRED